jgi:hypothetical protein
MIPKTSKAPSIKEQFYSAAIQSHIQLLWMQNLAMRIALWLVVVVNFAASTIFFVGMLVVNDRTQFIPQTNSGIVVASALFPFVLCFIAAVYAAGLLMYRWRVRRAVRRQATIVPQYDMSLSPIEVAALIGSADYRSEAWHLVYRLVETGNVKVEQQGDGTFILERVADDISLAALRWYEKQLLEDVFVSERHQQERLLRSMSPERLTALDGIHYETGISLETLHDRIGAYYLSDLNELIRTQLIREGVFHRFGAAGMWLHMFLYTNMFVTPFFAIILTYSMLVTIPWNNAALQLPPVVTAGVVVGYTLTLLGCTVWFLRTNIYTRFGLKKYVEAEGLRLYLEVALKDKLEEGALGKSEMARFLPYAQVMGLVDMDDQRGTSGLLGLK